MTFIFICAQLPHESTVSHENTIPADDFTIARQRSVNNENKYAKVQHVAHLRPETPTKVTHHHDDDDFEETSSNSSDKSTWSHHDSATTAQQKGGKAETKTYMNNSRRMTSVQFYHNATEKGRAQTKLTWTSVLLIISLFSSMWRSVSLCWCSGLSFFSWYFSWCLFFSTRKPQIQNTPFKSIIAVKIENLNDVTEGQV